MQEIRLGAFCKMIAWNGRPLGLSTNFIKIKLKNKLNCFMMGLFFLNQGRLVLLLFTEVDYKEKKCCNFSYMSYFEFAMFFFSNFCFLPLSTTAQNVIFHSSLTTSTSTAASGYTSDNSSSHLFQCDNNNHQERLITFGCTNSDGQFVGSLKGMMID